MADLCGYAGKILWVDLSAENYRILNTADYLPKWVGARGIGAMIHWQYVKPETKAFDPENVLSFLTGASGGIIDGRTFVQGVSPLGYPVESYYRSTMGSFFGAELKHAGWDGVCVVGKASRLSYILIEDDRVRIMDGTDLYQMDTYACQQHLWAKHGEDYRVALVGPAGENMVCDSHIQSGDHNACGLGGFGAVMGSKNLKAICVRGTLGAPPVYDAKRILDLRLQENALMEPNPGVGAAAGSEIELAGQTGEADVGYAACFGCQQPCGYRVIWKDRSMISMGSLKCGEFISCSAEKAQTGEYVGRNHYRRISQQGFLGITGQPSYRMVIQNDIKGIFDEPITLLHNGILTEEDFGIPYKYGTPEFMSTFNTNLAYRKTPVFDALAKGEAYFCNEYLGTPDAIRDFRENAMRCGIHSGIPGFYIHMYRCAGLLMRCTSTVNSGDQRGLYHYLFPQYEIFSDRAAEVAASLAGWEWTFVTEAVRFMQNFKTSMDLLGRCFFNVGPDYMGTHQRLMCQLHEAITGMDYSRETEEEACDAVWLLERAILMRQGHAKADDWLYDEAFDYMAEYGITQEGLRDTLAEYYPTRGLDWETGYPTKSEFARHGMTDIASELETVYGIQLPA